MADFFPDVIGQGGPQIHHLHQRGQRPSLQGSYFDAYGQDNYSLQLNTHAQNQNLSPTSRWQGSHKSPSLSPHSVAMQPHQYKADPQPSTPLLSQHSSSPVKLSRSASQVSSISAVSATTYQPPPPQQQQQQQQQQQSTYPQAFDYFSNDQNASLHVSAGASMAPSYDPTTTYGLDLLDGGSTQFGSHAVLHSNNPHVPTLGTFGFEPHQSNPQNPSPFSAPELTTPFTAVTRSPSTPTLPPTSIAHKAPQLPKHPAKRRRNNTPPKDPQEMVIGSVLSSGKFTCQDRECKGLSFGRLADLRRHWGHTHVQKREEYFCSVPGCGRAHKNTGGKGRSFGNRKDKRDEHMRNVHKNSKKRSHSDSEDEDDDYQF